MPRRPLIGVSSALASVPPNTGQAVTAAYSMPGSRVSMPNAACPVILTRVSSRAVGLPARWNCSGGRIAGSVGSTTLAASPATAP